MSLFQKNIKPFGLDFSDTAIKMAQFEGDANGHLHLIGLGRHIIPTGVIEDGEILNSEALASFIKEACKACQPNPIKSKFVIYSIPETKGFIRVIKVPFAEGNDLVNLVFAEAEQVFPISLDEAYVDWEVLGGSADNKMLEVLVAAVPQKFVDSYAEVMKKAGLRPVAAEIESIAITRSLVNEKLSKKPILIIDLGKDRTGFIIFKSPAVQFTASIPVCGKELNAAIAKKFGITEDEAEVMKNKCGVSTEGDCAEVYQAMDYSLREMTGYINKLLGYYRDHYKDEDEISKVIICGGEARMDGIGSLLSMRIKKEVENGNPWINVIVSELKEIPPIPRSESLVFVTVLGLALRGASENSYI
jgi:type IV pilus assembly protein PilM